MQRSAGQSVLDVFGELGDRRVRLFRDHSEQVRARRQVEDANPDVHTQAVALRERTELAMLAPAFARDLQLPADAPQVRLLVAAFTDISAALDALFQASPGEAETRQVLDDALRALQAMLDALADGARRLNSGL